MGEAFRFLIEAPLWLAWGALFAYSLFRASVLLGGLFFLYRAPWFKTRKVSEKMTPHKVMKSELLTALQVFALDSTLFLVWTRLGLFRFSLESDFFLNLRTFLLLFVWVEVWFYGFHRLIHRAEFYWIHRTHHRAVIPNPLSAFSFSMVERIGLFLSSMLFVAIAGSLISMSLPGILSYFVFNMVFAALGHTDLRMYPDFFARVPILKYLADPAQHSLHHSKYRVNFGLFTNVLDRAFGTFAAPPDRSTLSAENKIKRPNARARAQKPRLGLSDRLNRRGRVGRLLSSKER